MKWSLGLLMAFCVFAASAEAGPVEGVAWGTTRAAARNTCYSNVPGGRTVVRRGPDGNFYGTRRFGAGAYLRAATVSNARASSRTRGHLR